ncbi:hypothetical protein [Montanilutibacter psychrotolerans]|nr:hypothetical protein [Lysobacter psychrotolerans]
MKSAVPHAVIGIVVGIALVAVSAFLIWPQLSLFLASDACLGSGGSFDFSRLRCDFNAQHPYAPFALWPFWSSLAGVGLGLAMLVRGLWRLGAPVVGGRARVYGKSGKPRSVMDRRTP